MNLCSRKYWSLDVLDAAADAMKQARDGVPRLVRHAEPGFIVVSKAPYEMAAPFLQGLVGVAVSGGRWFVSARENETWEQIVVRSARSGYPIYNTEGLL